MTDQAPKHTKKNAAANWRKSFESAKQALVRNIKRHPTRYAVLSLLILGFVTRFWRFGFPNQAVFDEVYFGKFVSGYYTHEYFFDIHPPLGKLLIAGFAWLFRYNPTQSFAAIGTTYTDATYLYLRFLPGLLSALLPLTIYGIGREIKLKHFTAWVIGMAIVFENAFITQGRFILIDSFLILFGFASLWAWLVWRRTGQRWWLVATAILAGLSVSVKWTGLVFVALICAVELASSIRWQTRLKRLLTIGVIVATIYVSGFVIHLGLLSRSGAGDVFMTQPFQKTLVGSQFETVPGVKPLSGFEKFVELNREMYAANARLTAGHPYGSRWYGWPIMYKPISYWVEGQSQIWLFGNPFVWWSTSLGVLTAFWLVGRKKIQPKQLPYLGLMIAGFLLAWLPFATITRVMFLYHYLIPLGFATLISGFIIDKFSMRQQIATLLWMVVGFILAAPFTYGYNPSLALETFRNLLPILR